MKKKFAFLLMGNHYNPDEHKACFETENQITYIFTVRNLQEAYEKVSILVKEGIGAIELCGAFKEENAKEMIELTNNKIAIGYVIHREEQDNLFEKFFENL